MPAVSIVLPACGRMDLLDRSLDALMRQSLDPRSYDIIVVGDEPNHHTLHLVAGWRTRNRGWRAARADIDVVCGRIGTPVPVHPTDRQRSARAHAQLDFTSASCFIRKPVLERMDGFDERFNVQRGADTDLRWRATAAEAAWLLLLTVDLCVLRLHGAARSLSHVAEMVFTSALLPPLAVFWRLAGAVRYRVRFA